MLSKNSSDSRLRPLPQLVVPVGIEDAVGRGRRQVAQIEQLLGEVRDQRVRPRVGEHAPHLLLEHASAAQPPLRRDGDQLVVRNAAPQEERQPRRELEIGDAVRPARRERSPARARRARGTAGSRAGGAAPSSIPSSKVAALAAFVVEGHQRRRSRRASADADRRGARASSGSVARTARFLAPTLGGPAGEDLAAARESSGRCALNGP